MQPTPPLPPDLPPAPPAPPLAPTLPSAPLPEGQAYQFTLPKTIEQVRGLRERMESIEEQLESARGQRSEIAEQLQGAPEGRGGIERQLQVVDERIIQLERDLSETGRLVTGASPELLAQTARQAEERRESQQSGNDEDEVGMFAFTAGVLLTLVVGAVRRRFGRRKAAGGAVTALAAEDPRIDRLTQAVDAIALEVERIGEGQRFMTQLMAPTDARSLVGVTQDPPRDGRR